jgi:16S rRNA (cytidine1402-2'-O)-methyltransferase
LRALEHGDVALVSEAGMPGINDPGYDLVLAAIDHQVKVVPVPGPSAIPAALAVSGFTTEQFIHLGFLPRKKGARRKLLQSIAAESWTIVAFETPHRLRSALVDLGEVLGERRLAVCREMTKLHEEIFRGTVSQAIEHFAKPRGEFTLVIEGKARKPKCADRSFDEFESIEL